MDWSEVMTVPGMLSFVPAEKVDRCGWRRGGVLDRQRRRPSKLLLRNLRRLSKEEGITQARTSLPMPCALIAFKCLVVNNSPFSAEGFTSLPFLPQPQHVILCGTLVEHPLFESEVWPALCVTYKWSSAVHQAPDHLQPLDTNPSTIKWYPIPSKLSINNQFPVQWL